MHFTLALRLFLPLVSLTLPRAVSTVRSVPNLALSRRFLQPLVGWSLSRAVSCYVGSFANFSLTLRLSEPLVQMLVQLPWRVFFVWPLSGRPRSWRRCRDRVLDHPTCAVPRDLEA